jgi:hypothetical protein
MFNIDIGKLARIGGQPLGAVVKEVQVCLDAGLKKLLTAKNGFLAFESALHVFPTGSTTSCGYSIEQWNSQELWKHAYGDLIGEIVFFAEDIFGEQFGIKDRSVFRFNPETAALEEYATSIDAWARRILSNPNVEAGYGFADRWQTEHRKLLCDERLVPLVPFVAGGQYNMTNVFAANCIEGMKRRAALAKQIKDVPDGTKVKFDWIKE